MAKYTLISIIVIVSIGVAVAFHLNDMYGPYKGPQPEFARKNFLDESLIRRSNFSILESAKINAVEKLKVKNFQYMPIALVMEFFRKEGLVCEKVKNDGARFSCEYCSIKRIIRGDPYGYGHVLGSRLIQIQ